MRPPRPFPKGAKERLFGLLKNAKSKPEYQRVLCVWLRALLGLSAPQVAEAIGWHVSTVRQLQARYLRDGEAAPASISPTAESGEHFTYLTNTLEGNGMSLDELLGTLKRNGSAFQALATVGAWIGVPGAGWLAALAANVVAGPFVVLFIGGTITLMVSGPDSVPCECVPPIT